MPCFKLGIRFDDPSIIARFVDSNRPGYYLAVLDEGEVGVGDAVQRVREDDNRLTVTELFRLMVHDKTNVELMRRCAARAPSGGGVVREIRESIGSKNDRVSDSPTERVASTAR